MSSWIIPVLLVITGTACIGFYCLSTRPATMERKFGEHAYALCTRYRLVSAFFMCVHLVLYPVYVFHPISAPIPPRFPWPWWISIILGVLLAVPSSMLLLRGARHAGSESLVPRKRKRMFSGIYRRMRHPQAAGELALIFAVAVILDSLHLFLFSLAMWAPGVYLMCRMEENDLEVRYGDRYRHYKARTGMFFPKHLPGYGVGEARHRAVFRRTERS